MYYNSFLQEDRQVLATDLEAMLTKAGFVKQKRDGTYEDVYVLPVNDDTHNGRISVLVYTSIEGGEIRECGTDAIRVCAVYSAKDGKERGIAAAEKRVNRVGDMSAIVDRTYGRMRDVYKIVKTSTRCKSCNAPVFVSKAGKECCADICWVKKA